MFSKKTFFSSLAITLTLISSTSVKSFAQTPKINPSPITTQEAIILRGITEWEPNGEIYSKERVVLKQKDESTKEIEDRIEYSTTVEAENASEAIEKVEGSAGTNISYANLSGSFSHTEMRNGRVKSIWKVTGTKICRYIQYYDLYVTVRYTYEVWVLKNGPSIIDIDYEHTLISTTEIPRSEYRVAGRTTRP